MKKFSKIDEIEEKVNEEVGDNSYREILPQMIRLSNNSPITMTTAMNVAGKLDKAEFRDFKVWLKLIESNMNQIKQNNKKYW